MDKNFLKFMKAIDIIEATTMCNDSNPDTIAPYRIEANTLSDQVGIHPKDLREYFKFYFNMTTAEYIREKIFFRVLTLLESDYSISTWTSGLYYDHSSFCKAFKKRFNVTISQVKSDNKLKKSLIEEVKSHFTPEFCTGVYEFTEIHDTIRIVGLEKDVPLSGHYFESVWETVVHKVNEHAIILPAYTTRYGINIIEKELPDFYISERYINFAGVPAHMGYQNTHLADYFIQPGTYFLYEHTGDLDQINSTYEKAIKILFLCGYEYDESENSDIKRYDFEIYQRDIYSNNYPVKIHIPVRKREIPVFYEVLS